MPMALVLLLGSRCWLHTAVVAAIIRVNKNTIRFISAANLGKKVGLRAHITFFIDAENKNATCFFFFVTGIWGKCGLLFGEMRLAFSFLLLAFWGNSNRKIANVCNYLTD